MDHLIGIAAVVAFLWVIGVMVTVAAMFHYRNEWLKVRKKMIANVEVDLELATTQQLMSEMRKRPPTYLMILPKDNIAEGMFELSVEIHNIEAVPAAGMLKMAAFLAEKELKKNGIDLPEFKPEDGQQFE
jgi:hypothetical protein